MIVSIFTAFSVNIGLIKPAESRSGELVCGMQEHQHNEDCFTVICGLEYDMEHVHSAECIELSCGMEEHIHTDECYDGDYEAEPPSEGEDTAILSDGDLAEEPSEPEASEEETIIEQSEPMYMDGFRKALRLYAAATDYYEFYYDSNKNQVLSNFFTAGGSRATQDVLENVQYDGKTFNDGALKLDSNGWLKFTPTTTGTLIVVHAPRTNKPNAKVKISYNGTDIELSPDSDHVSTQYIDTANIEYTIQRSADESHLFYARFTPDPVEPDPINTDPTQTIRIEARVIFGDYNDDGSHNFNDITPVPQFQLHSRNGTDNNLIGGPVNSNVVADQTEARKDWCYQYNYTWDVSPVAGSGENKGYYVELVGDKTTVDGIPVITIDGKDYKVYYLRDDRYGHPGANNDTNGAQSYNGNIRAEYPVKPEHSFRNDSGALYIYLDPLQDWQWGENVTEHPNTINISMKKRWDGHNSGGFNNRPKEKIRVQLQRWDGSKWVKYTNNFNNENYYNWCYYEVTDENGNKHFVNRTASQNERDIYSIPGSDDYKDKNGTKTITAESLTYENVKDQLDPANGGDRIRIYLDETKWNDIVLTLAGDNHPQHFTNGYYYVWNNLPYGQYRVIETESFYDAGGVKDEYDEGVDRNTAEEYYYMEFPPSRDSSGVLHIQNFTKDMVLEVQKEWYDDQGKVKTENPNKTVTFNVYRSTQQLDDPTESQLDFVFTETTDDSGYKLMKTTGNPAYPDLELYDDSGQKYYYYIQEVSVAGETDDSYSLKNGNSEGFVRSTNGDYGVDFEDGDARKFFIENKTKVGIKLQKEWYLDDSNQAADYSKITDKPDAEFEIYKGSVLGDPAKNGENYTVNGKELTKIADAVINENGQFEIVGGDRTSGNGTSKIISDQLHMYGQEEVFNGTKTFSTGNGKVFEPGNNSTLTMNNGYFTLDANAIWVKPQHGFGGALELKFTGIQEGDKINWRNKSTSIQEYDLYSLQTNGECTITLYLNNGDNKNFLKSGGAPKLKSAVFYPYNYYYIREKTSDNYELINGKIVNDAETGFVRINNDKYYLNLSPNNLFPTVTAKNKPKMEISITKKWFAQEDSASELTANFDKSVKFQIYKAYSLGVPSEDNGGYKIGTETMSEVSEITGYDPTEGAWSKDDLPAYEYDNEDDDYKKVYYYIREADGSFKLRNSGAANGFIADKAGNYGSYFDESGDNARSYELENVPKLKVKVDKVWSSDNTDEIAFTLLRATESDLNNITKNGSGYTSGAAALEVVDNYTTLNQTRTIEDLNAYNSSGELYYYYVYEENQNAAYTVSYTSQGASWSKEDTAPHTITITNTLIQEESYTMPNTGGKGAKEYIYFGGAIVLLSAATYVLKRRYIGTQ